ncbi:MAG: sigma 54-interacting transcriptional regulator [Desulfobacterales bacterium]|nr:sigma 54-interacting transcriptional regulator [Desulfobacterales bacterium]
MRDKYSELYDFAPSGYATLSEKGLILEANLTCETLLEAERGLLLGKPFSRFIAKDNQDSYYLFFRNLLGKKAPGTCELKLKRESGETAFARLDCIVRMDAADRALTILVAITDTTERKKMDKELQKAHDKLEQQVEERTAELRRALSEIKAMKDQLEAENIYFRHENKMRHRFEHIIGQSDGLKYVLYRAEQVAPVNTTVLILGETGTGKELIAAAIHNMSPRKERPLIIVNCAALPANLIESELFGREKGAFTGADTRRVGRFEVAHGSTICLDEIGELPLEIQAKLLRVIQHSEFERLGSSHTTKVDVRIVATTNRDLEQEVRKGLFRQDLYYRLNVFPITVPPLRQRKADIPLMVEAFVERYAKKFRKEITSIPNETLKALQDYPWPGNVRELESIIERAVILCPGPVLQLAENLASAPLPSNMKTLEETERNQILKVLSETRWRLEGKNGAAAILGLHPSTLRARMHKLGIVRPETR